jgi:hypothetical protein
MGWTMKGSEFESLYGKTFSLLYLVQTDLRPIQPPTQWVPGLLFSGVKRQERETDHSPLTSAEVKKTWIYASTPSYALIA